MIKSNNVTNEKGPLIYENWKVAMSGEPLLETVEYQLFTDYNIGGEILDGFGPYKIFNNTVSRVDSQIPIPAFTLRLDNYLNYDSDSDFPNKTNVKYYHGGSLTDEITALLSLSFGFRLKAGGVTRHFDIAGDPKGRPTCFEIHENPFLQKTVMRHPVLPQPFFGHPVTDTRLLCKLPSLIPDDAVALISVARVYQDAIWIAETEPELSWIMLVSAVESAALHWSYSQYSPIDKLKEFKPELVELLEEKGDKELIQKVANILVDYIGSTRKFVDFILEFLPEPPRIRPAVHAQISWKSEDIKKSMKKIYNWRSRALHGGTPFPYPMCMSPAKYGDTFNEKPLGLAFETLSGVWIEKDIPMLLHTFEYIVRHVILKWWESMLLKQTKEK